MKSLKRYGKLDWWRNELTSGAQAGRLPVFDTAPGPHPTVCTQRADAVFNTNEAEGDVNQLYSGIGRNGGRTTALAGGQSRRDVATWQSALGRFLWGDASDRYLTMALRSAMALCRSPRCTTPYLLYRIVYQAMHDTAVCHIGLPHCRKVLGYFASRDLTGTEKTCTGKENLTELVRCVLETRRGQHLTRTLGPCRTPTVSSL